MFRLVALITFAILLVRNQILLINKQMIYRHLTFTFHFHFPHRVFKKEHPSGVLPSRKLLLRTAPPPPYLSGPHLPRWCWENLHQYLPLSHSHTSYRLHEDVATLEEFIFRIHSDVWIQVCYSHTLVCLSSLWLGEKLNQLHLEMGKNWHSHRPIVFLHNVLP